METAYLAWFLAHKRLLDHINSFSASSLCHIFTQRTHVKDIRVGLLSLSVSLKYLGRVNINSRNFIALSREQSSERGRPGVESWVCDLGQYV